MNRTVMRFHGISRYNVGTQVWAAGGRQPRRQATHPSHPPGVVCLLRASRNLLRRGRRPRRVRHAARLLGIRACRGHGLPQSSARVPVKRRVGADLSPQTTGTRLPRWSCPGVPTARMLPCRGGGQGSIPCRGVAGREPSSASWWMEQARDPARRAKTTMQATVPPTLRPSWVRELTRRRSCRVPGQREP